MNAVALVVYEDFIRPFFPNMPDQTATRLVKGVSLLFSGLSFSMVFLVAQVKTILDVSILNNSCMYYPTKNHHLWHIAIFLQATVSFDGAVAGSILGVFTLGIFVPFANPVVSNLANILYNDRKLCLTNQFYHRIVIRPILCYIRGLEWACLLPLDWWCGFYWVHRLLNPVE